MALQDDSPAIFERASTLAASKIRMIAELPGFDHLWRNVRANTVDPAFPATGLLPERA